MCQRKKKQSISTLPYHLAPSYLRFNPYIKKGYRGNLSTYQCFHSVLCWTNETLNIWSHIIGFTIFLGLLVNDITVVFYEFDGTESDAVIASYVLISFMMCMILSSLYHTLNCRSKESCMTWLSYDIFGISASFLAIFLSGIYYGFWCSEFFHLRCIYSGLVCMLFAAAMAFLLTPRLMGQEWEWARVTLFTVWAVSGVLPTVHWLFLHGGITAQIVQIFLPRVLVMYLISGAAALVYVWKIPERYFPGRFDFIGASHQLWHLIIVVALVYWHQTGIVYARYRMLFGCSALPVSNSSI